MQKRYREKCLGLHFISNRTMRTTKDEDGYFGEVTEVSMEGTAPWKAGATGNIVTIELDCNHVLTFATTYSAQ